MAKKQTADNSNKKTGRKSGLGRFALLFLLSAWMFILGILVGRGTAPVQFDMEKIEAELAALREAVAQSEQKRYPIMDTPKPGNQHDLEFHEALKKRENDQKLPEEALLKAAAEKKKQAESLAASQEPLETVDVGQESPKVPQQPGDAKPEPVAQPVSAEAHKFTIQVSAVKDPALAKKEVQRLTGMGFQAYQVTADIPGKGVYHRIRIGSYPSRQDARDVLERLKKLDINAILVKK